MNDRSTVLQQLIEQFERGERRALARLLSLVENEHPVGLSAMAALYRRTGHAEVVGVTGPPGAGKSTLTNALIRAWRTRGRSVGVLAVDPSSSLTGGATLGDRIRMLENWADDRVYIRSMATRGQMGGLSTAVGASIHLLDAFGFDTVCVETVGVGQDEVDIAEVADTVLLLQVPGLGDSIQTIKAGILEIADILVVNKADAAGAAEVVRDLRNMLRLGEQRAWVPPIVETVATEFTGIDNLVSQIERHQAFLSASGEGAARLARRLRAEVARLARRQLTAHIDAVIASNAVDETLIQLETREIDPLSAARIVARIAADRLSESASVAG
ncbi:MAG: methylmalonyl Co-A mutase-associated GTPase MeaB [Chloroflexi bacterium]|nr:MAG: methylmalonyl Co-A mutase-associated GTPase MeaB [Chloroflexota bacterium]